MLTGTVALKEDDLQFISSESGDIVADNPGGLGLYHRDTRFLSRFELTVNGFRPVFLSHSASKHYIATFQSVNPAFTLRNGVRVKQQTISIRRSRFVTGAGLYERIGFLNCNHFPIDLEIDLATDADFRDMFSVRGFKTQRVSGEISIAFGGEDLTFTYAGRDGVTRKTHVTFDHVPEAISPREVRFSLQLEPNQAGSIVVRVQPRIGDDDPPLDPDFDRQVEALATSYRDWDRESTTISTDNELFDRELLRASRYDIRTLLEQTPQGAVPDAGVPWYAVPFGRDAIITALQTLVYNPAIAEGTLRFLAAHQGEKEDLFREEQPGKIMHELRRGELARLGEVPHTPYFGTVDATPLFLVLFVETMEWLDSDALYHDVMPAALRALEWIDRYGDMDGDGYLEYIAQRPGGVVNQGWKDSFNAVQYDDGGLAEPPIALVEVQGYVYHAKMGMSRLLRRRGERDLADRLQRQAEVLRTSFNRDFWIDDLGFYAQALDKNKRQIRSITSNPGHALWSGICDPDKARRIASRLMEGDMFSGWGLRTLSADSPNFNPMSYHNGSVWPHDTALIALGFRRIGCEKEAVQLATSMIEAGFRFPDSRLPELFCGFARDQRFNSSPAAYIVSCSPQAWAAGCVFMLLQIILDIRPNVEENTVSVDPDLPALFKKMRLEGIRVGRRTVDLHVENGERGHDVDIRSSPLPLKAT